MTTEPTTATGQRQGFELPKWASALIILVLLSLAAWFCYHYFIGGRPREGVEIDVGSGVERGRAFGMNPRRMQMQFQPAVDPRSLGDGVHDADMNRVWVRSGDYYSSLPRGDAAGAVIRVFYAKDDLISAEERSLLEARQRLTVEPALAKELNVTEAQTAKLVTIPLGIGQGMQVNSEDREKLRAMWQAYQGAAESAKAAAEKTLLATLKEIGDRSLEATRKLRSERAARVKEILTPEQISAWQAKGR